MSLADPDIAGAVIARPARFAHAQRARRTLVLVENALRAGRVSLAFQPVVRAGEVRRSLYHEALVRVTDDDGRCLPAGAFLPAIERAETGRLIDCRALELGLGHLARDPDLRLAINISPRSIGSPQWMSTLDRHLSSHAQDANRLVVEVTESSAMLMPDTVKRFLHTLRRHGVRIALDDFGAGFTAFRYLRELPLDILKIDGQFSQGISEDKDNQVLMRALISIGQHFGMTTVAESVETRQDADWLTGAGIDCLQGYHIGRPKPHPPRFPADTD